MSYAVKTLLIACSTSACLNSASAMLDQETQESFPINQMHNNMVSAVFKFLTPRDQLSLTQTSKHFRPFLKLITGVHGKKGQRDADFYQWVGKLEGLLELRLPGVIPSHAYRAIPNLPDQFATLKAMLNASQLNSFACTKSCLGDYIQSPWQIFQILESLPTTLQEFDVSDNLLYGKEEFFADFLTKLAEKPRLRVLKLSDNHDLGRGLWSDQNVKNALSKTSLEELHLEHTSLSNACVQALLELAPQTHLTTLIAQRSDPYKLTPDFIASYRENPPQVKNKDGKAFTVLFD